MRVRLYEAPIAELDASGNVVYYFIYGTKRNIPDYAVHVPTSAQYRLVTDQLGSLKMVVNTTDATISRYVEYDEFGRVLSDSNPDLMPFGFAGGMYDNQTKLTRFGARDYDADTGRWTNKDPIRFHGGDSNLYGYVLQDPVNLVDVNGLAPGDVFTTPEGAARDFSNYINPASIALNREFASWIYQWHGGYTYTSPVMGLSSGSNPGQPPSGYQSVIHTHGAYDPNYASEFFSPADVNFARHYGVDIWVATPNGQLNRFDVITGETLPGGNRNACGP